ncbi:hypothetical protein SESBI_13191 [Sesbania bispinosa]|nr:hypothetical protein SESBI_13191 [Sesbania bispinosa]
MIEKLNKKGFLGQYDERRRSGGSTHDDVGGSGRSSYNKQRRESDRREGIDESYEIRGVVTTIAGGFYGGGETSLARIRYI